MFLSKKLLFLFTLILSHISYSQTLVINEFSNGPSGVQEYIELIVIDTSSTSVACNPCIDIRGWIIDDNNGYHGSYGIASGCNRFSNDTFWSCIPTGTIITVYNGIETNIDMPINDLDVNDGNCQIIVPIENSTLFESNSNTPGAVICDYPNTGWVPGGVWSRIGMRNAGDCIRLVDLSGCEVFSMSYGDITLNSNIYFSGSGVDDIFYFSGNNPFSQADWFQGCAGDPGACTGNDQTPGIPNSNLNDAYINQFIINGCQPFSTTDTNTVNLSVCENELPYTWNGLIFLSSGTQSTTLTSALGCDSTVSLNLSISEIDTNTVNLSVCENELPYTWNGLIFSSSGTQITSLVSTLGCDSIVILNLSVNGIDTNTVDLSICENELPYNWNGLTFLTPGTQIINLTNSLGCDSTIKIILNVTAIPFAPNTSGDMVYCMNEQPAPIEVSGGSGIYTWYTDIELLEILSIDSNYTPEVYLGNMNYYVTITENGCESPAEIVTVEFQACSLVIPSAFTPNGDNINDFWEINDIDLIYPNNTVQVFNRWGNKIYESKKGSYEQSPWNGEINGNPLPVGTYYYIIYYHDQSTGSLNGIVSILK